MNTKHAHNSIAIIAQCFLHWKAKDIKNIKNKEEVKKKRKKDTTFSPCLRS